MALFTRHCTPLHGTLVQGILNLALTRGDFMSINFLSVKLVGHKLVVPKMLATVATLIAVGLFSTASYAANINTHVCPAHGRVNRISTPDLTVYAGQVAKDSIHWGLGSETDQGNAIALTSVAILNIRQNPTDADTLLSDVACSYQTDQADQQGHISLVIFDSAKIYLAAPADVGGSYDSWQFIDGTDNTPAGFICVYNRSNHEDHPEQCPFTVLDVRTPNAPITRQTQ